MPSFGVLGAIGGAAEGFSKSILLQMDEAKKTRLENLRAKNNLAYADRRHENRTKQIEQGHELSLQELKAAGDQERDIMDYKAQLDADAPTAMMKNIDYISQNQDKATAYRGVMGGEGKQPSYDREPIEQPVLDKDGNPQIDPVTGDPLTRVVAYAVRDQQQNVIRYEDEWGNTINPNAPQGGGSGVMVTSDDRSQARDALDGGWFGIGDKWDDADMYGGKDAKVEYMARRQAAERAGQPFNMSPAEWKRKWKGAGSEGEAPKPDSGGNRPRPADIINAKQGSESEGGKRYGGGRKGLDAALGEPGRAVADATGSMITGMDNILSGMAARQKFYDLKKAGLNPSGMDLTLLLQVVDHLDGDDKKAVEDAIRRKQGQS